MIIAYVFVERLKDHYAARAVEISCLESLFKIREDVIRSEDRQQQMDELTMNSFRLMSQVSSNIKKTLSYYHYSYSFVCWILVIRCNII